MRKLVSGLAVAFAALLVGGCSPVESGDASAVNGSSSDRVDPIINREIGVAVFGSVRYQTSHYVESMVESAARRAAYECGMEQGLTGWKRNPPPEIFKRASSVGVWRMEDAENFGFMTPLAPADQLVNRVNNEVMSDSDRAAGEKVLAANLRQSEEVKKAAENPERDQIAEECSKDPVVMEWRERWEGDLTPVAGPWFGEFQAARDEGYRDERVAKLKAEYVECLASRGVKPESKDGTTRELLFAVQGQDHFAVTEQQVKLAVDVVHCKDEINAVERLLSVMAEYEEPVYEKYEDELLESLQLIEANGAAAEEFWAEHDHN